MWLKSDTLSTQNIILLWSQLCSLTSILEHKETLCRWYYIHICYWPVFNSVLYHFCRKVCDVQSWTWKVTVRFIVQSSNYQKYTCCWVEWRKRRNLRYIMCVVFLNFKNGKCFSFYVKMPCHIDINIHFSFFFLITYLNHCRLHKGWRLEFRERRTQPLWYITVLHIADQPNQLKMLTMLHNTAGWTVGVRLTEIYNTLSYLSIKLWDKQNILYI